MPNPTRPIEPLEPRRLFAAPTLVADLNQTTDQLGVQPGGVVQAGNLGYFAGHPAAADGNELFKTDATPAGTTLVRDINPGQAGSEPDLLTDVGGTLYFTADDGVHGRELWKSDGTAAGTTIVADLAAGPASSAVANLTALNGYCYFTANNTVYRTDGTAAGTVQVKENGNTIYGARDLVAYNGSLLMAAASSYFLYKVDGTVAAPVTTGVANARYLKAFNGYVYFTATGSTAFGDTNRGDLFRTDGTAAGTTLVRQINFLSGSTDYASTGPFTVSGDRLYFVSGSSVRGTYNLFVSDGYGSGTVALTSTNAFDLNEAFAPVGSRSVLFTAATTAAGTEPWVSDGTAAGTKLLKDINPGAASSDFGGSTRLPDGRLLFTATNQFGALTAVYTTDGTAANTLTNASLSTPGEAFVAGQVNGVALLVGLRTFGQGDLYRTDGTARGTVRVGATLAANGSSLNDYVPGNGDTVLAVGDTVYFTADNGTTGFELWKTVNGAPPQLVYNSLTAAGDGYPSNLTAGPDGTIYFTAGGVFGGAGTRGVFYCRTNADGTTAVGYAGASGVLTATQSASNLVAVGNQLFFTVTDTAGARPQLRVYNAYNNSSTRLSVSDVYYDSPTKFTKAGNYWYFGALPTDRNGVVAGSDQRVYRVADVANALPEEVARIAGPAAPVAITPLGAINAAFYFSAYTAANGTELWKTDGTAAGTTLVLDRVVGTGSTDFSPNAYNAVATDGVSLFFSINDADGNTVAYRTDGTAAGTRPVDASLTQGYFFVQAGGRVYFDGKDSSGHYGLYRADDSGATLVGPTGTGDAALDGGRLIAAGGNVYVVGLGGDRARWELWQYTPARGTFEKAATLAPRVVGQYGPFAGFFGFGRTGIAATGTDLYFPMYEPATGVELHRLAPNTTTTVRGTAFTDANANGVRDNAETGASGVRIYLDANNNGAYDAGERLLTTNADGSWFFDLLSPGTATVRVQAPTDGRRLTTAASVTATVAAGQTVTTADFGVTAAPPEVVIDGPTTVVEGGRITLDGSQSYELFGTVVAYAWDLDYDRTTFDTDATTAKVVFDAANLDGPSTRTVALRVTDANGVTSYVTMEDIAVTNAPPTATLAPVYTTAGTPFTVAFTNAADPGVADTAAGFTYSFDFNNDGDFTDPGEVLNSTSPSATFTIATNGTYSVRGRIADKNGGYTDYRGEIYVAYPPDAAATIEAETGVFANGTAAAAANAGYTGTGYADFAGQDSSAAYTLTRNYAGPVTLAVRYANGAVAARPLAIYVNDTLVGTLACPATGSWATWATLTLPAQLKAGTNAVRLVASTSTGGGNVDSVMITARPPAWLSASAGAAYGLDGQSLVVYAGTVTVSADIGLTDPNLLVSALGGRVVFNTTQHLGGLTIGTGGSATVTPGAGKLLRVKALTVAATARLDLADASLIVDASSSAVAAKLRGYLATARTGGTWAGAGVGSGTADANGLTLGLATGADFLAANGSAATFAGETVGTNAVLVRGTLAGDVTLNGRVDFNDFLALQNNFGTTNAAGDVNFDGAVDFNDFLSLQNNFGKALANRVRNAR